MVGIAVKNQPLIDIDLLGFQRGSSYLRVGYRWSFLGVLATPGSVFFRLPGRLYLLIARAEPALPTSRRLGKEPPDGERETDAWEGQ
jgi:hypothetical protein